MASRAAMAGLLFDSSAVYLQGVKARFQVAALLLAMSLSGCLTTQRLLTLTRDWAVGIYKATAEQIRVADRRAAAAFARLTTQEKTELKESGTRYLAVRTSDPTPAQLAEIRRDMTKPASRYGSSPAPPGKIYCVMIWDTHSQEIVGNDCYAVLSLPKDRDLARFDTYTAQYLGTF